MKMDGKISFDLENELPLISSKLKNIDEFLSYWRSWKLVKPEKILRELKELSTIQSVASSTRIEGSKLSDKEVKDLINNLKINKMESRDEQEVSGYFEVLALIYESYSDIPLTEPYIKQLHNILLKYSDKDTRHKGTYKALSNKVVAKYSGGSERIIFNTTEPFLVETEMQTLIQWTNESLENKRQHPLIVIAAFIYEFLSIHPFQDGNGRLSRVLTSYLMMKFGYSFIEYISFEHVIEKRKKEYYQSLMECQKYRYSEKEKIAKWIIFFLECIENMIFALQNKFNNSSSQNIGLNARQMNLLKFISSNPGLKISQIQEKLGLELHRATLKVDLNFFVSQGLIQRKGRGRGTWYEI